MENFSKIVSIKQKFQLFFIMFVAILLLTRVYIFQDTSDDILYKPEEEILPSEKHNMSSTVEFPPDAYYMEPCRHPGVSNFTKNRYDIIVVTGASNNHFCPMKSLVYRLKTQGFNVGIIAYDLGLEKKNRKEFYHLARLGYVTEFRIFNFSAYPSFWDLKKNRGEYAWKVGMVAEVARDYPGKILVWMDAGTMGNEKYFTHLKDWMPRYRGFISPTSGGPVSKWIHRGVFEYFHDDHTSYDDIQTNCNAASIAFDTKISQSIIDDWYKCALNKDCIAPPGSSRRNHRQDQAIITYLVAKRGILCRTGRNVFGISTHLDHKCKAYNKNYERKNWKNL
ncbi:hypothetical protein Glove_522g29 [Diversispora epigaea]|uniref:DUF1647 domain-containing protein n=1 Tax=Diversispora epigaea TaxID=1348612 RepID=A0A397GJW7_9GLOM|nr:hypothetical protein Glove_522g29 [Diversispora epigaea]